MHRLWVPPAASFAASLAACLLAGCGPNDNASVRSYEAWLEARFHSPQYAVGTPRSPDDIVFLTDLRTQAEKGLSKVQMKDAPDRVYYIYATQTNRLLAPVFSDGLAAVALPEGRWTYIDASGRFAFPTQFRAANPFVNGVATAQLAELGSWVLLTKSGSIRELDTSIATAKGFSAGRAEFSNFARLSGYIDEKGAIVIPATFSSARAFCPDGTAVVRKDQLWGLISLDGKFVRPPEFDDMRCYAEDLAAAKRGKWGFLNRKGAFAIQPRFASVQDFSEGLASFRSDSGAYGFIDRTGAVVVPAKYAWVYPFQAGIAKAGTRRINWLTYPLSYIVPADPHYTSWTYINKRGTVVASGR